MPLDTYVPVPGLPGGSDGKESSCNTGDPGSFLGQERSPGEGNGYQLQYSCMENSKARVASQLLGSIGWQELNKTECLTLSLLFFFNFHYLYFSKNCIAI